MSDSIDEERKAQFLLELTELTKKHGIAIGGCGCCGSPWISNAVYVEGRHFGYCCDENDDDLTWTETEKEKQNELYS